MVEDATHVLLPSENIGKEGDFVIYSPHKLLGLPDGALLLVRPKGANKLGNDFIESLGLPEHWKNQAALLLPHAIGKRRLFIWTIKRCLQKLGFGRAPYISQFGNINYSRIFPPPAMSSFSQALLSQQLTCLPKIAFVRKRNQYLLDHLLMHSQKKGIIEPFHRRVNKDVVPYQAGYRILDIKAWFFYLQSIGMPLTTWPDLPNEVSDQYDTRPVAIQLRESCFFIPLHQSISGRDLINLFPNTYQDVPKVRVELYQGDAKGWQDLMELAKISNLLQSWDYGECKARISGWQVRRFLIYHEARIIGFVQVLQRCIGKFLCVSRLNRGPIFLSNACSGTRYTALKVISNKLGNWRKGRILSWAPECTVEDIQLLQLLYIGFRQVSIRGWSSSILDLKLEEAQLRAGLTGNWRNILNVTKRDVFSIKQSSDTRIFELVVAECAQMMKLRGLSFSSIFYRELHKELMNKSRPGLLLVACYENQLIAATYVVIHGNTATYLWGWSGDLGRKFHAHHLLLWENVIRLKEQNICYFDLGGIDVETTPGIASFKLGMGGHRYQLVGEGWCL